MPRVADLGDCPLCFGKLLPLSVCQSCNSTVVRDRLEQVEAQIACEDCGATNPTHFVCSACNARFPYREIARPQGPTCPVCKSTVPPGAPLCPKCSAVLPSATGARPRRRLRGEFGEADVQEIGRIPGVTRERAEALCRGGYPALWKIARAPASKLASVRGIGARAAAKIKEQIAVLRIVSRPRTKEEVLAEEVECPLCGTVTSLFATRCHDCGAVFDEEELDEELAREVEREEEKGLLAYYDVRLLESPESPALLYARSLLLVSIGRPTDALASLDKFLELEPGNRRALQAKARVLASVKGVGSAAQVLRGSVATTAPPGGPPSEEKAEQDALRALRTLEEQACPECGEKQVPGAAECPACGHRFAPEAPSPAPPPKEVPEPPQDEERIRLLEELERAVAGETKVPPPPLRPVVPESVVDRKRDMYTFLANVPGVSRRAAEAAAAFFQDLEQIGLADVEDLEGIPGVAPAEARLMRDAVERRLVGVEAPPPKATPPKPPTVEVAPPPPKEIVSPPPPAVEAPARQLARAAAPAVRRPLEIVGGRRGLVNGKGLVNGRGRVNGLINGTGFVNGGSIGQPHLPRQNLMPRYIAVGASLLMLFAIVAALSAPGLGPVAPIKVDGSLSDWTGISAFNGVGTSPSNSSLTIMEVAVSHYPLGSTLFARVQVADQSAFGGTSDYRSLYMFLDADGSPATGYEVGVIGADYAARVSGGGAIDSTVLLRFEGVDAQDWNRWRASGTVLADYDHSNVELAVSTDSLEGFVPSSFRAVFAFDDNAGSTSHTELPIGPGPSALRVRQETVSGTVGIGPGQQLLRLSLRSLGSGTVDVQDIAIATSLPYSLSQTLPFPVDSAGTIVTVSVDTTGLADGANVSASASSVQANAPYAILGPVARAYVGQVQLPAPKRIDGLFGDWTSPSVDGADTPPVKRPSLDILSRDGAVVGNDVFLYAHLAGPVLEGGVLPQRLSRPQPPGGGGGGGGGGGPGPPRLVGQDYIRFYLDTNESEPGGFDAYGLLVDRYVEVLGRGGRVADASLYRWNGTAWQREGSVDSALGVGEIELSAAIPAATFNMTRLVAVTADWSGTADVAQPIGTRGTRSGPGLIIYHGGDALTATASALTNMPTIDGECGDPPSEYAGADFESNANLNFSVGAKDAFVYVCVRVGTDNDDNTGDWAHLYFDRDHDGVSPPEADDRRFNLTTSDTFTQSRGDGTGWVACGSACAPGNDANGMWNTSWGGDAVYEFKISFWDVWLPSGNATMSDTAGFAIIAHDDQGSGTNFTWGSTNVTGNNPYTWGHLEIPEFGPLVVPLAVCVVVVIMRRRRR